MVYKFEILKKCSICNSRDISYCREVRNHSSKSDEIFTIYECNHCGVKFLNPRFTIEEIVKEYQSGYNTGSSLTFSQKLIHVLKNLRVHVFRRIRINKNSTILDVGCGDGFFLKSLKNRGIKAEGLEIDSQLAVAAEKLSGCKIHVGQLNNNTNLKSNYYDLVTMFHFLEHSYDPRLDILEAKRVLKNGGALHIEVPNEESIVMRKYIFKDTGDWDPPFHTYHFNESVLRNLLEQCGFVEVSAHYPISSPYLLTISIIRTIGLKLTPVIEILVALPFWPLVLPINYYLKCFNKSQLLYLTAKKNN